MRRRQPLDIEAVLRRLGPKRSDFIGRLRGRYMASLDAHWQVPASDDINPDALEYLFISQSQRSSSPPWVEIVTEPEPAPRLTPEIVRLQTKVELLAAEVDILSARLQQSNCQVGFLLAQVAERDKLLQQFPAQVSPAGNPGDNYECKRPNSIRFPVDSLIYVLMLGFAWAVLITVLS